MPRHLSTAAVASSSLLSLASAASTRRHLDQILSVSITTSQLTSDLRFATKLADRLAAVSSFTSAFSLLQSIPSPDLFLINVLIRSAVAAAAPSTALSLLSSLPFYHPPLVPDAFTLSFAASAAAKLPSPSAGRVLHARAVILNLSSNPFVASSLCSLYLKFSLISPARKVFDRISPHPDTICYNTLISGLTANSHFLESLELFREMLARGLQPDATSLAAVLPAAAELQTFCAGLLLHCMSVKLGLDYHSFIVTGLISMYSKCEAVYTARLLFENIHSPDLIAWNSMISGYSINGCVRGSVELFKEMFDLGIEVSSSTFVGLIPVHSPFGHEYLVQSIHALAVKFGLDLNPSVSTAFTTVYSRLNDIDAARRVFDAMREKTLASWNAMISACAQNGLTDTAISLFKQMKSLSVRPNPVTVTSILSACAQLGTLLLGKWVHKIITDEELEVNVFVSTALVDMYAKCGNIQEARRIFDSMKVKNVVSWNAMLSGYGLHGQSHEALLLFKDMLNEGVPPTGVSFLSVIHACSHGGLVEEGKTIFNSMESDYRIKPGPEHFAAVVDLLGRAGHLNEALEFIMSVSNCNDPGSGVWGALLGACMIHKQRHIAELASKRLFELDPENPGYYVLLSNIYSAGKSYKEAAEVRQTVKSRKMVKAPGCTLIEINDTQHIFTSGDQSHPETSEIYDKLEEITSKITEAGYCPETSAALYDVEEEEKGHMVRVHSEKLAISFGLIKTSRESEIRIIKNLRVCLDCHSWTKLLSKVTGRIVVVRDANRFHHFKGGVCSCGDYW